MTDNTKKLTIKEFRMWLEGVEEMQEEGWTPNTVQWRRIRDKLNEIDDTPSGVLHRAAAPVSNAQMIEPPRPPAPSGPVQFAPPGIGGGVFPTPSAELAQRPFMPETTGMAVRTPNIDTTGGNYVSAFS